jgi:hypothetical protein
MMSRVPSARRTEVTVDRRKGIWLGGRLLRPAFNDLARAAKVEAIVTRSISGHLTERMLHHHSTVRPEEQRASIASVIRLFGDAGSLAPSNCAEHGTTSAASAAAAAGSGAPNTKTG